MIKYTYIYKVLLANITKILLVSIMLNAISYSDESR